MIIPRNFFFLAIAAFSSATISPNAQAVTHNLNLTGTILNLNTFTFERPSEGLLNIYWWIDLDGLNNSNSFLASAGDRVTATVVLDQSISVLPATVLKQLSFSLSGPAFGANVTNTLGTMTFSNAGTVVGVLSGNCFSGDIATCSNAPKSETLIFDKMEASFEIRSIESPGMVTSAEIRSLRVTSAVPEPESYALMLCGLAATTAAIRRQRRQI